MDYIDINTNKSYRVVFGDLERAGAELARQGKRGRVAVITDSGVAPHYLERLNLALSAAGFAADSFIFAAGEGSKTIKTVTEIVEFLAGKRFSRTDTLIALGGGIVGDVTGFAAAMYLRGVDFMQIPTTLLAAVDSSVGGKTGVNLDAGKNLIGAFNQPILVLVDEKTLQTLPDSEIKNGLAECVKYAFILDKTLIDTLSEPVLDYRNIIERCILAKASVVSVDERDVGIRQILNFGHTVGHAIEALTDYGVAHGAAVAVGMAVVAKGCCRVLGYADEVYYKLCALLDELGIAHCAPYSADDIFNYIKNDKKMADGLLTLVTVPQIGRAELLRVTFEQAQAIIRAGLQNDSGI